MVMIFGGLLIFFVIGFFSLLLCPKAAARMKKYEKNFGMVYEKLTYDSGFIHKLVPIIFMLKRIIFVTAIFYVKQELILFFLIL